MYLQLNSQYIRLHHIVRPYLRQGSSNRVALQGAMSLADVQSMVTSSSLSWSRLMTPLMRSQVLNQIPSYSSLILYPLTLRFEFSDFSLIIRICFLLVIILRVVINPACHFSSGSGSALIQPSDGFPTQTVDQASRWKSQSNNGPDSQMVKKTIARFSN